MKETIEQGSKVTIGIIHTGSGYCGVAGCVAIRAKALGSNSLKCPVVRKKPLRVKNSPVWCVRASSLVRSIAFRPLFLLLRIILVFMASIKCTVDSSTFPRLLDPLYSTPRSTASFSPLSEFDVSLTFSVIFFFFSSFFLFRRCEGFDYLNLESKWECIMYKREKYRLRVFLRI